MKIDLDYYLNKSNLKWLKERTVYITVHGSHAYGTNTETSDIDVRGIAVPPKEYYFGILDHFEQAEFKEIDFTIFDIRKFIKLASDCNPNALELLFTSDEDHIVKQKEILPLLEIRDKFISKKVKYTMSGYAFSQLKRINLHRRWILYPPKKKPERSDFGLPNESLIPKHQMMEIEAEVDKKINEWRFNYDSVSSDIQTDIKNKLSDMLVDLKINTDDYETYAIRSLGLNDNLLESFRKERQYRVAKKEWGDFLKWKEERNKARYELEEKYNFDTKHASHLYRLLTMCEEVLETGKLLVKRPDAPLLLEIRNGKYSYDELMEIVDAKMKHIEELYIISKIPNAPDRKAINDVCIKIIESML